MQAGDHKELPSDETEKTADNPESLEHKFDFLDLFSNEEVPPSLDPNFSGDQMSQSDPVPSTSSHKTINRTGRSHAVRLKGVTPLKSSQEPWPNDCKLYQPYEVEQILLPDNANCLAVQAFMRMARLQYELVLKENAEAMSPSGKVPFIRAGAFLVSELEDIVRFAESRGVSLTDHLDDEMKADLRAYMSLVHNVLENAELYLCWVDDETYNEVTRVRHGSIYPWPLNHVMNRSKRSQVVKKLKSLGWYDKSLEEVFQEVENCCQALSDRLEGKDYFFEDKVTEVDALLFGHVKAIIESPHSQITQRLRDIIRGHDNIIVHFINMERASEALKESAVKVQFNQQVELYEYKVAHLRRGDVKTHYIHHSHKPHHITSQPFTVNK